MKQIAVPYQRFLRPCIQTDGITAATVDYGEGQVTAIIDCSKTNQPVAKTC